MQYCAVLYLRKCIDMYLFCTVVIPYTANLMFLNNIYAYRILHVIGRADFADIPDHNGVFLVAIILPLVIPLLVHAIVKAEIVDVGELEQRDAHQETNWK